TNNPSEFCYAKPTSLYTREALASIIHHPDKLQFSNCNFNKCIDNFDKGQYNTYIAFFRRKIFVFYSYFGVKENRNETQKIYR
ncbi:MAG: hypothetical protein UH081_07750, partial [Clostridia bacterium]|nr:hypothetical protein [Clostridia bacterium]